MQSAVAKYASRRVALADLLGTLPSNASSVEVEEKAAVISSWLEGCVDDPYAGSSCVSAAVELLFGRAIDPIGVGGNPRVSREPDLELFKGCSPDTDQSLLSSQVLHHSAQRASQEFQRAVLNVVQRSFDGFLKDAALVGLAVTAGDSSKAPSADKLLRGPSMALFISHLGIQGLLYVLLQLKANQVIH